MCLLEVQLNSVLQFQLVAINHEQAIVGCPLSCHQLIGETRIAVRVNGSEIPDSSIGSEIFCDAAGSQGDVGGGTVNGSEITLGIDFRVIGQYVGVRPGNHGVAAGVEGNRRKSLAIEGTCPHHEFITLGIAEAIVTASHHACRISINPLP